MFEFRIGFSPSSKWCWCFMCMGWHRMVRFVMMHFYAVVVENQDQKSLFNPLGF